MNIEEYGSNNVKKRIEHESKDFPVSAFYVEPAKMYMGKARLQWHEDFEFDIVKEGSAIFTLASGKYKVNEGQAVFINGNVIHSIAPEGDSNCVILSVACHPRFLFPNPKSEMAKHYLFPILYDPSFRFKIFSRDNIWERGIHSYIEDLIVTLFAHEYGYELEVREILDKIWLQFIKNNQTVVDINKEKEHTPSADEMRIKDALIFIEKNYGEEIMLEDIADSIHVSKSECCRCFKRAMGMTPFDYLMRIRILKAADLITKTQKEKLPISEIAFDVGFNNTSYFNKRFKDYFGCTPSEYRKQSRTKHRDSLSPYGLSITHI